MTKLVRRQVIALMGATVLAGALGGAAVAQEKDLKFWVPLPLTGPLAVTGQAQQVGWQHAVDWINKDGGIKGRNIAIEFYDDEYKVELGVAGFKKAVANGDVVFSGGDGTPFVRAISPENNETYKVLMSSTGAASDLVDTQKYPLHFLVGSNYSDQIKQLFNYIKAKGAGNKVAIVYSASEFGRDPLENARKYAAEMGIDIVLEQETKFVEVDVTSHAIQVRQARPDYVIFHGYAANVWPEIVKLLRDYGVEAQVMGTIFGSHPDVVSTIGDAADNYLGTVTVNLLVGQSDTPMMKTINGYLKTWTDKPHTGYANIGYMQSWGAALLLREAIGAAIEKGVELNGENLIKEMNAIEGFDGGGVFGTKIKFENNRIPYGVLYRYNIKDGKLTVTEETPWGKIE
ncbi:ABC transporter substrate-binding protein [Mesorhizobium sp. J428]|uniref:ABC transporter substrate-binding protein n=1 Tax=Mesorhizobium sp. J428 TaxID=2898440 RepID=UPI0021512126|nr:ABC transporter substrate-binding protein [Mesorhizobium sp. J428]MCR5859934.1 ABC transporter substrate-binding protein [Mesorhizobium sp. J428]